MAGWWCASPKPIRAWAAPALMLMALVVTVGVPLPLPLVVVVVVARRMLPDRAGPVC